MSTKQQVTDETGAVHTLSRCVGKGGQGEVWLAQGGRRIVKLLTSGRDSEVLRRQLAFIRRLDLTGLHVARPIALLRPPHVGYVAEFLDDMVPIASLIKAPNSGLVQWHIDTGGLRRRLRLLAHAGEALSGLHSRGVIYADVSHNNIFVSEPIEATEAWLIDLDNLSHESAPDTAIYTPFYGAPEIVSGSHGCTSLSDAWAFAVLVWQTLTLTHPFVGDMVNDGEPELEDEAVAGRLPWVGHSTDDQNLCTSGLPSDLVVGVSLQSLARRTFEDGLTMRPKRPSVSQWVQRLHSAADQTLRCPGCKGTYFPTALECPWCEEPRPELQVVKIARWKPDHGIVQTALRLGQYPLSEEGLMLTRRITQACTGLAAREPHVELTLVPRGISIRTRPGFEAWVAPVDRAQDERHAVTERRRIVPRNGWMLFFEDPAREQRIALLGRSV